jgi:Domain of unknown function (DUF4203)
MQGNLSLIALGAVALGIVQCFFGYRIFRVVLGITGFFLGGLIGGYLALGLIHSQIGAIIGALIGGLIGAALMAGLYIVGVFLIGALFGAMIALAVLSIGGSSPSAWIVVIAALAAGVLAAVFQRVVIVLATAFGGAWWTLTGIATLAGAITLETPREWLGALASASAGWLIGWLVLGIVGLFFQYRRVRS